MSRICLYAPFGPGDEANAHCRTILEAIGMQGCGARDAREGLSGPEALDSADLKPYFG